MSVPPQNAFYDGIPFVQILRGGAAFKPFSRSINFSGAGVMVTEDLASQGVNVAIPGAVAGGAWEFIQTLSMVGGTELDVPLPANEDFLKIEITNFSASVGGSQLQAFVTNDNFATVEVTGYEWYQRLTRPSGVNTVATIINAATADAVMELVSSMRAVSNAFVSMTVYVRRASIAADPTTLDFSGTVMDNSGFFFNMDGYNRYSVAEIIDGIRFAVSAGVSDATISIYRPINS